MILYLYVKAGRNGKNNDCIKLPYSYMAGIMNKTTFSRAIKGLIEKEWVEKTKQGGLMANESTYRLTLKHDGVLKK